MDGYVNSIIVAIWNSLVSKNIVSLICSGLLKVSQTEIKFTLTGFYHNISILTGYSATLIDLFNDHLLSNINETSLLQRDSDYLVLTPQDHDFWKYADDAANHYSGKQYIHYGNQVILMKFDPALMDMDLVYVSIW